VAATGPAGGAAAAVTAGGSGGDRPAPPRHPGRDARRRDPHPPHV